MNEDVAQAQTGVGRARLLAIVGRVLDVLEPTPGAQIQINALRRSAIWTATDEDRLLDLSATLDDPVAAEGRRAATALNWVRQLHARVMAVDELRGYGVAPAEEGAFAQHRRTAIDGLTAIRRSLERSSP